MPTSFAENGVSFKFPETWTLQREETESGWAVTVSSPETAFFLISFDSSMPEMEHMAQTALEALKSEYPGLEADECVEAIAGQPAYGYDLSFFSFDLTNTGWLRSFYSVQGTVLVLWQANDLELENVGPVLRAMCASIAVEDE